MKSLKRWEKRLLRLLPRKFRPMYLFAASLFSGLLAAHWSMVFGEMQFVTFDWFGEGKIALTILHRFNPGWLVEILADHKFMGLFVSGTLTTFFLAGYFWGMRLLFLERGLPEHCIQEARKIIDENTEFSELLEHLIRRAKLSDDGNELGTANFTVRQLVWNRKKIKIKQTEIEKLEEEIKKQEEELKQV